MFTNASRLLVLCTILALLLIGSVAAQEESSEGSFPLNPEVSGEVEFWHFWGSPARRNAIRRVIAECEQQLPNITVTEVFKPWGEIWTANLAAVAAGSGMPDVIVEDRPQLPRIAADGIEQSLQPFIEQDGINPEEVFWPFTWDQTLYEGESYGMPFETDVRVLFYNRNLFAEAGLDPENPPQTWEEVREAADQLTRISESGEIERLGFFPLYGNVGPDVWAATAGHEWVQDGAPVADDPVVADTLNWITDWIEQYGGWDAVSEFRATFGAPPNDAFMSGRVAMIVDIAGYNSTLNFYDPRITLDNGEASRLDWGVALIPYSDAPSSVSGGFALSIPTGAENPEAAWEFIKCATSREAQVSWARDTYAIPANEAAATDTVLMADERWQFFIEAMESSTALPYVAGYPNWYGDALGSRFEQVWRGELTVEEMLQQAQEQIDNTMN